LKAGLGKQAEDYNAEIVAFICTRRGDDIRYLHPLIISAALLSDNLAVTYTQVSMSKFFGKAKRKVKKTAGIPHLRMQARRAIPVLLLIEVDRLGPAGARLGRNGVLRLADAHDGQEAVFGRQEVEQEGVSVPSKTCHSVSIHAQDRFESRGDVPQTQTSATALRIKLLAVLTMATRVVNG